jgi:hypothetical protein
MADLFKIDGSGLVQSVPTDPFLDEVGDLEQFLKKNPGLLGDGVQIFAEQMDTGAGDRIDLLAVDQSSVTGQLLLIELKNVRADIKVLLQALRYATWIVSNPDSIRYQLSRKNIDAESVELKPSIWIVAPDIDTELIEMSWYVSGFEFSFIQIERFRTGSEHLVVVQKRIPQRNKATRTTVQDEWNWEKYQQILKISPERIANGKRFSEQLKSVVHENGWNLEMMFRKGYCPFQLPGSWNVFDLSSTGATGAGTGWTIAIKLPSPLNELDVVVPTWVNNPKWEEAYKQVRITIPAKDTDLTELQPLLAKGYEYVRQKAGL